MRTHLTTIAASAALLLTAVVNTAAAQELNDKERLGELIFFDDNLSINRNQSCAVCHQPEVGWTGPDAAINAGGAVYEGSVAGLFGNRKPPSSAYATPSPIFHFVRRRGGEFVGGNFWNGRATGEKLGNPAADQAQGPFLNPLEQALPDSACVVERVCNAPDYGVLFTDVWEGGLCTVSWPADLETICADPNGVVELSDTDRATVEQAYDAIALSIAAFEDSPVSNAFSSKYDAVVAGRAELSEEEDRGLKLFRGKANCVQCHTLNKGQKGEAPLFTDFTFDNVGAPKNPDNPFYVADPQFNPLGAAWIDLGLGEFLATRLEYEHLAPANYGKQKIPTLRNVDKRPSPDFVKAYLHNGVFKSLKQVVHFYNTRDVLPTCPDDFDGTLGETCWPAPEVAVNVNTQFLGDLRLSDADEDAIVAFLTTLSDGFDGGATPAGEFDVALDEFDVPKNIPRRKRTEIEVEIENYGPDSASGSLSVVGTDDHGNVVAQYSDSFEDLAGGDDAEFSFVWTAPSSRTTVAWAATVNADGDTNASNNTANATTRVR